MPDDTGMLNDFATDRGTPDDVAALQAVTEAIKANAATSEASAGPFEAERSTWGEIGTGTKADWNAALGIADIQPGDKDYEEAQWDADVTDLSPDEAAALDPSTENAALTPDQQAALATLPPEGQALALQIKIQADAARQKALIEGIAIGAIVILGGWWLIKR